MMSLFILTTCVGMTLIAEVAYAWWWLDKRLRWLRNTLIPWINNLNEKLGLPK